jgi:hypothetical protein
LLQECEIHISRRSETQKEPGREIETGRERAWSSGVRPPPRRVDHHDGKGMLAASSVKQRGYSSVRSRESAAGEARDDRAEHAKEWMSGHDKGRPDGHVVEREDACSYAAFQCEIWLTTGSDAEEPKDGEPEEVVASGRRRKIGTRAADRRQAPKRVSPSSPFALDVLARRRLRLRPPLSPKT